MRVQTRRGREGGGREVLMRQVETSLSFSSSYLEEEESDRKNYGTLLSSSPSIRVLACFSVPPPLLDLPTSCNKSEEQFTVKGGRGDRCYCHFCHHTRRKGHWVPLGERERERESGAVDRGGHGPGLSPRSLRFSLSLSLSSSLLFFTRLRRSRHTELPRQFSINNKYTSSTMTSVT